MKTFLSLTFAITLLIAQSAVGQDYVFRVLANKGSNQVKKAGSSEASSLKTGSKLTSGDQIIASAGAYIGLVHRTGKTMEIRTPGTHNVNDLEGKVSKGTAGVAGRYMNFVMNKMNEGDGDVNKDYKRNLRATGAVERAAGSSSINLLLKEVKNTNRVYGDNVIIRWETGAEVEGYVVVLQDVFGKDLLTLEATDPMVALDLTQDAVLKEKHIMVKVSAKDNPKLSSRLYGLQRMAPEESQSIEEELNSLTSELEGESALNQIVIASFFEEKNLYVDALTAYEKAVAMSPEVEDFDMLYSEFKLANGLGN
ncbi:MAG: hypothetical protein RJQ09_20575 [Cyclobacteriaceae bacterium]